MYDMNNTYKDFEDKICDIAILPIGAIEQHGPHLPLSVDHLQAERVSKSVAEKMDAYLLPGIPFGNSETHIGFKGSVTISSNTLKLLVIEILQCLIDQGFKYVAVLNMHGGNLILKTAVREINLLNNDGITVLCNPFLEINEIAKSCLDNYGHEIHAGEFETSVMMHLDPKNVRDCPVDWIPDVDPGYFDLEPMKNFCPDGVWGKASLASIKKGEKLFNAMINATVVKLTKIFDQF